jgi:hypothetical protein
MRPREMQCGMMGNAKKTFGKELSEGEQNPGSGVY